MSGFICSIRVYPLHPIVIFHCFENNSNGQVGWQYAYAGNESTRSNRKGHFYTIPDSFRANMKSYSIPQYERQQHRTTTSLSPNRTSYWPRGIGARNYFRLSWFQSSLLLIYFRYGGRDRAAQLHSVTEFVPRSPIFCVNRSSVWCGFCVRARPIRYSMNKALVFFKL